jgi:hypothetical protein
MLVRDTYDQVRLRRGVTWWGCAAEAVNHKLSILTLRLPYSINDESLALKPIMDACVYTFIG